MPLVSIAEELRKAHQGRYAIPCFDTIDQMGTRGIVRALEENGAPGILGLYRRLVHEPDARAFANYVRTIAEDATVPISVFLDHGGSLEDCMKALSLGFTDVMIDASKLPLEENIRETRAVVRAAHAMGASVEAELGHVGSGNEYEEFGAQGKGLTDPDAVGRFVEETDVDFLAIAVGTAHGFYQGEPQLHLDLLAEIRSRVDVPLVLHGGSGLSDDQFRAAISKGISKINIFTSLATEARDRMVEAAATGEVTLHSFLDQIEEGFQAQAERHLALFGTIGRAG